ncbi:MAG TPA: Uma2 family endonuclease [Allocoleopsis sp.]
MIPQLLQSPEVNLIDNYPHVENLITEEDEVNLPQDDDYDFYIPDPENFITEDDEPMDNWGSEKQQRFLSSIIYGEWSNKKFLVGTNIGIYYQDKSPAIVPDLFISLDVEVPVNLWEKKNRSYMMWRFGKSPELVIEIVSNTVGEELGEKMRLYQDMKVLYYVVFDPQQKLSDEILRIYELRGRRYVQTNDNWLSELELGVTLWTGEFEGANLTWLRWCDRSGNLILSPLEKALLERQKADLAQQKANEAQQRADLAQQRADLAEERAKILAEKLRELGIDPDS